MASAPLLWNDEWTAATPHDAFDDHLAIVMAIEQGHGDEARQRAEARVLKNVRRIIAAKLLLDESLEGIEQVGRAANGRSQQ